MMDENLEDHPSILSTSGSEQNNNLILNEHKIKDLLDRKAKDSELGEELCKELIEEVFHSSTKDINNDVCDSLYCFIDQLLDVFKIHDFRLPEGAEGETLQPSNIVKWINYFYLQFCGYQYYLVTLGKDGENNPNDLAAAVVDLMDEIAENSEYLHFDSDVPEEMARNLIWNILNSQPLRKDYLSYTTSQSVVSSILKEFIEKLEFEEEVVEKEKKQVREKQREEQEEIDRINEELARKTKICKDFLSVYDVAEHFVADIMNESIAIATNKEGAESREAFTSVDTRATGTYVERLTANDILKFPAIKEFSIDVGRVAIRRYLNTWSYEEDWTYEVVFLMAQSDACSDFYFYELHLPGYQYCGQGTKLEKRLARGDPGVNRLDKACKEHDIAYDQYLDLKFLAALLKTLTIWSKWSLPNKLCPIAQATASILFKIEVSRVKPSVCPVDVTYKFEGNGFTHSPMEIPFQESWLFNILESKLLLYSKLTF